MEHFVSGDTIIVLAESSLHTNANNSKQIPKQCLFPSCSHQASMKGIRIVLQIHDKSPFSLQACYTVTAYTYTGNASTTCYRKMALFGRDKT